MKNLRTHIAPDVFQKTKWFDGFTDEFVVINRQLLKYNGNAEHVIVPEGVETIGHSVFCGNTDLRTVTCPPRWKGYGRMPLPTAKI